MDTKISYVLVGLFVILLGAAFITGVVWLTAGELGGRYLPYEVHTSESVSGLSLDAPVRYRGVPVGRVDDISLVPGDPTRVRLRLEILEGTPIKTDTVATLEMQGLTGLRTVNLVGGSAESPPLTGKDDEVPVIPSRSSLLSQLDERAAEVIDRLSENSERLNRLLSDANVESLSRTLTNLEAVTAGLSESRALMEELRATAANLRGASESIERDPSVLVYGAGAPRPGPGE